jgi:GT2 family glycosyltransferase
MNYIVIPNYIVNEKQKLLAINAIASFRRTCNYKIVAVDDGSPMDTTFLMGIVDHYIKLPRNVGFAKACNAGFRFLYEYFFVVPAEEHDGYYPAKLLTLESLEDYYIVCANNDIEVYPGWEEAMREPFERFENVGVTGLPGRRFKMIDGKPITDYVEDRITEGGRLGQFMQQGALWMSRKSVLEKVGIFDEKFERGGMEDVDLFLRMRDTYGMKIVMSGKSVFWHEEGATRFKTNQEMEQEFRQADLDNEAKFEKKWGFNYRQTPNVWHENPLT